MHISTGARVASFEVGSLIGSGGMGTVYRARDTRLQREVAIKFLHDHRECDSEYLLRFQREARVASALNHPNIVTVFEIGEHEGAPFIAMELVEGVRLREALRPGPLPVRKLLNVATQIADGLAAAHDRSLIHRDIKPDNVVIGNNGVVKILDFGLARRARQADPEDSTAEITREADRRLLGTAAYMSPEQVSGAPLDVRSDQFSFGSMLYEMATGQRAFRRDSTAETLDAIIHDEPDPIQRSNPRIPDPLCWIIERCLAKDPNDRYASTTDLATELRALRDRLSGASSGETAISRAVVSRRNLSYAAIVAAIAVFVTGVVFMAGRSRPAPPGSDRQYLAVLPFTDANGEPENQALGGGFAEAISSRLARSPNIQVIPPTSTAPLLRDGADDKRIAAEFGATLVVRGTVQQSANAVRVHYQIRDSISGATIADELISGSPRDLLGVHDEVSDSIARRLGVTQHPAPTELAELETADEQDVYLRVLGLLLSRDDEKVLDEALDLSRELLETASGSALVHSALSRTYAYKYALSRDATWSDRSIRAAERARNLAPGAPEVLLTTANVEYLTGRYTQAVETFTRALALYPNSPEAVLGLGSSYLGAGKVEEAERTFRRGIALRPGWWLGHNELGAMYLTRGRFDDAEREFKRVVELNPRNVWGYSNLGAVHLFKERLSEAASALKKAVSIREDANAYSNLAYCYYYLGQYGKSANAARRAASLKPKVGMHWSNLADACRWVPECKNEVESSNRRAIEVLQAELVVNQRNPRAHAVLAVCLAKAGRRRDARTHIGQALELDPKNPTRMLQAARVANLGGDLEEAVSWLRRAVDAGHGEMEFQRDPEFEALRDTKAFRSAFAKKVASAN